MSDVRISGAGTISSGSYGEVHCSGSARANGDIKCTAISVSGSMHFTGNVYCTGSAHTSGSLRAEKSFAVGSLSVSGSFAVNESVSATDLRISGSAKIGGDCSAERAEINGALTVNGLLNAGTLRIYQSAGGMSKVGSIGGGSLVVERAEISKVLRIFNFTNAERRDPILSTSTIEVDEAKIEFTEAETVRTINAVIGKGCKIGTLEYSGTLTVDPEAVIRNIVKR